MDKRELREKLQHNFNLEEWKQVLEACFPNRSFYTSPKAAPLNRKEQQELAEHIHHVGEVDLGDAKLAFIDVKLKENATQLTRNRVGLRKLVDSEVIAGVRDAAIIVYHQPDFPEWRISFYSEQYGWDEKEGIVKEETNAKRYTFVVGGNETCRTPSERLQQLVNHSADVTLKDVMKAFSVEKVSKRFFDEYKHQYDKFVSYLTGKVWTKDGEQEVEERINQFNFFFQATSDHEKEARDFVKKLLGRVVFLYFVQKKGWLGASSEDFSDGSQKFIRELFEQVNAHGDPDQFYGTWLRKLFFEGLNEKDDLSFDMPDGSTCYMPFLNGGLFERDETDKNTEGLILPGKLFHNADYKEVPEDKYDRENKRGFLDFLDAFNFTIHEDSPGDHTIAVDPEMLGHIFENLLEDNKEKGAYYTPKPIVHYMCQESIIEYLNTKLAGNDELRSHIESLIKDQETGEVDHFFEVILKALKEVRVCDPAIGSGAFPMGILQEIYQTVETIYYASPDSVIATWELNNADWNPAAIKKQIIQHSIYGVDIEQGAVDIAQLRFWLSLIVDENEPTPLPNLEYKIRTGNSLLSSISFNGEAEPIEIDWEIDASSGGLWGQDELEKKQEILQEIHEKQDHFFNSEEIDKESLGLEIRNLKIDLLINQLQLMINTQGLEEKPKGNGRRYKERVETYLQTQEWNQTIEKLNRLKKQPDAPFNHFEWKLDFPEVLNPVIAGDNAGFDVVIGNPPYRQLQTDGGFLADLYEDKGFETFERTGDIYSLFYEKGFELLKQDGVHTFITSNKWMRAGYGESLREYLSKQNPKQIIDLGPDVFDNATVDTNILIARKGEHGDQLFGIAVDSQTEIKRLSKSQLMPLKNVDGNAWKILSEVGLKIENRIKEKGKPLSEWDLNIYRGLLTGYNTAFIIDTEKRDELVNNDESSRNIVKPLIRGRNTERYKVKWNGKYVIKTFPSLEIDIDEYPAVRDYLLEFMPRVKQTGEKYIDEDGNKKKTRKKTSHKWFETQDAIGYHQEFTKPKIVWKRIGSVMRFSYLEEEMYCLDSTCIATGEKIKYLVALLNSKLCLYQLFKTSPQTGTGDQIISVQALNPLEVYYPNDEEQKNFETLVDYILHLKEIDEALPAFNGWPIEEAIRVFEQLIDGLVYELYFHEEFEENGIEILSYVGKDFQSIESIDNDQANKIIGKSLKIAVDKDGDITKNMQRLYKLEEVQAIENEVN